VGNDLACLINPPPVENLNSLEAELKQKLNPQDKSVRRVKIHRPGELQDVEIPDNVLIAEYQISGPPIVTFFLAQILKEPAPNTTDLLHCLENMTNALGLGPFDERPVYEALESAYDASQNQGLKKWHTRHPSKTELEEGQRRTSGTQEALGGNALYRHLSNKQPEEPIPEQSTLKEAEPPNCKEKKNNILKNLASHKVFDNNAIGLRKDKYGQTYTEKMTDLERVHACLEKYRQAKKGLGRKPTWAKSAGEALSILGEGSDNKKAATVLYNFLTRLEGKKSFVVFEGQFSEDSHVSTMLGDLLERLDKETLQYLQDLRGEQQPEAEHRNEAPPQDHNPT
jgi:hypothetical protein